MAEVYHALPPSAREVLLLGLQEHFDTLSFPTEWTEISATLTPRCVGPQGLKNYRPFGIAQCHTQAYRLRLDVEFASRATLAIFPGGVLA